MSLAEGVKKIVTERIIIYVCMVVNEFLFCGIEFFCIEEMCRLYKNNGKRKKRPDRPKLKKD